MARLATYKERVRILLEKYEKARNNDGTLLAYYINTYHKHLVIPDSDGEPSIKLRNLKHLPPIENIRRSRQLIQNTDGEYLPTDHMVCKARRIKERNWRDAEVREATLI